MKIIISTCFTFLFFQTAFAQSFLSNPFQFHYLNNTTRLSTISILGNDYYDGAGRAFLLNEMPNSLVTNYTTQFVPKSAYNPLWGNISMGTKAGGYPVELMLQGSQQGEGQAQLASRLYRKKRGTWEMHNVVDGYRYQGNLDKNEDGFQDLLDKNRIVALHSTSYQKGRFQTALTAHYMQSKAEDSKLDTKLREQLVSDSIFGLGHDVQNFGFTWNNNINLSKEGQPTTRRLNFSLSGMQHNELNFYLNKNLNTSEQFLNSNISYHQKMPLSDFSVGLMYRYQDIEVSEFGVYNDLGLYDYGQNVNRLSAFGEYNSFFGAATQFKSGIRVDYENEQIEVYPRLQLDFAIPQSPTNSSDLGYLSFFAAREKRLDVAFLEYQEYLNSGRRYDLRGFFEETTNAYDRGWSVGSSFTFNEFNFEIPGIWVYTYIYNTKILWRSILFEEQTKVNILPTDHNEGGSVTFYESDTFAAQHWLELASSFRFERFHTHLNYRINHIGASDEWLVPNSSLVITTSYSFKQSINTSLRFTFQGKQALNNGTTSPCIARLDWYSDFSLEQLASNYFTNNATFYFGMNNIFNNRQKYLTRYGDAPFGRLYDGSQVWGNTVGFQIYGGMKFNLRW